MNKGFTLVELLVVIAVILLLATIGIYSMSGAITRAKVARARAEISQFHTLDITGKPRPKYDPWGNPYGYNYSWGPAQIDYQGSIIYDPSNGTVSQGNIVNPNGY